MPSAPATRAPCRFASPAMNASTLRPVFSPRAGQCGDAIGERVFAGRDAAHRDLHPGEILARDRQPFERRGHDAAAAPVARTAVDEERQLRRAVDRAEMSEHHPVGRVGIPADDVRQAVQHQIRAVFFERQRLIDRRPRRVGDHAAHDRNAALRFFARDANRASAALASSDIRFHRHDRRRTGRRYRAATENANARGTRPRRSCGTSRRYRRSAPPERCRECVVWSREQFLPSRLPGAS